MRPPGETRLEATCANAVARIETLAGLDDQALLALMLTRGSSCIDPHRVAANLLERFGTLSTAASADCAELARIEGVGPLALADLKLLRLLAERLARCEAARRPVISTWSALLDYLRIALAEEPREQFRALFLDHRNQLMRDELVAHGTVNHAPVYPREVVRRALDLSASSIILVHNHPSGDPKPSSADILLTRQIVEAAKLFAIAVHDHLVVGRNGTASFKTLGLLP